MSPVFLACLLIKGVGLAVWFRAPGAGAALFFGPDPYLLYHFIVPSAQALCPSFTHFATERREIWLTIDDGPDETDTPRILDLLERHRARATFFVIGRKVELHPELVAEIVRRGHSVAHHTQTHPLGTFWCAGPLRLGRECDDCLEALRRVGVRPQWFRPPVGIKNVFLARTLARRGLAYVGWSVRSGDGVSRDPERTVVRVLQAVRPGAIVLMHEGPDVPAPVRVEALARLLAGLESRGYACVLPEAAQLR